ncbi:CvpA family protein [Aliarcobacter vitoriensis]|uniref:Colicin V synthesis protein n=1 Tax=Aliarcobacter vitoriensis TaxID=2011099 RepID=A0A366MUW7_9BACT|nr:CvpA family protein [Aliarcobacter vitoriensis]RBQ29663.1 colicin V synthesis protein [Aliarcobacter vitoriensis]
MHDIAIFDLVIILFTLLLGIKGLFRGFIKEVFGILGLVGAVFVGSRISGEVGGLVAPILALENQATIKLIGFIVGFVAIFLIVYAAGIVVSKIFSASGLGIIDRIFGLVFGMLKIFLVFSIIAYALYQVNSFKKLIEEKTKDSIMMPYLLDVGSYIIKLDTSALINSVDQTIQNVTDGEVDISTTQEEIKESIDSNLNDIKDSTQEIIQDNIKENIDDAKEQLRDIANQNKENE